MAIIDDIKSKIREWLDLEARVDNGIPYYMKDKYREEILERRAYRNGKQKQMLKTKAGQPNYNVTINFAGLIIDRSVSMLVGQGLKYNTPEGQDKANEWLDTVMELNRDDVTYHKAGLMAADAGTGYFKIIPNGYIKDGVYYPRFIALDSANVKIITAEDDMDNVTGYVITYTVLRDGKTWLKREIIANKPQADEDGNISTVWVIQLWEKPENGRQWVKISKDEDELWDYSFPPIVHWQNLPCAESPYGEPDITEDVEHIQNQINFTASNALKIIATYGHPMRYSKLFGNSTKLDVGPDSMVNFSDKDGGITQLDPIGDMPGISGYLTMLRQALFDITRSVDIDSIADKLGALTNFGLRVLYQDAIIKIETKRRLFGEAVDELRKRLLIIGGFTEATPGAIVWPEIIPANVKEQTELLKMQKDAGLVDSQTAIEELGRDYETVNKRLQDEKLNTTNIGAAILANFNRGV